MDEWLVRFHDGVEAPHIDRLTDIIHQNYGVRPNAEIAAMLWNQYHAPPDEA